MTTVDRVNALLEAKVVKPEKKKVLEKDVEARLVKGIKALGGRAYKFKSPGHRSAPDRICILSCRIIIFVECKRPGEKPTDLQTEEMRWLSGNDLWCEVVSTYEQVDALLNIIKEKLNYFEESPWITRMTR
jgi:hypothetical protein